jgi:hypothetical protein
MCHWHPLYLGPFSSRQLQSTLARAPEHRDDFFWVEAEKTDEFPVSRFENERQTAEVSLGVLRRRGD